MTEKSADGAQLDPGMSICRPGRCPWRSRRRSPASGPSRRSVPPGLMRNLGLVIALVLLCVVGVITAGDRFASTDNLLTILRLASVIGVVSIGMTFVITAGGIDLSVGAVVGLASVWATTTGTQLLAHDVHWVDHGHHRAAGRHGGRTDQRADGRVRPDRAVHRDAGDDGGRARTRRDHRQPADPDHPGARASWTSSPATCSASRSLVWIFALVAVAGWVLLNRTTFGRRTFAIGGNPEAARLAGIRVKRHTMLLYGLVGLSAGIAAVMIMARTTAGSSTHGTLYELDAIAAVVIGGTLLSGGRGTIVGTVFGVLIFTTLTNVFTLNNLSISAQAIAKGVIIVVAVLLQQRVAARARGG